jgi:hypothetical protein
MMVTKQGHPASVSYAAVIYKGANSFKCPSILNPREEGEEAVLSLGISR